MKGLPAILVTAFALIFAVSVTACTDSLVGPDQEEFENAAPIHTFDARHNFDPAASNSEGGDMTRRGSHNRVGDD